MAYDENLAARIDELVEDNNHFTKKKMFGGVGYLYNGNMCIGVHKNELIVRCNASETDKLLTHKNVRVFDITGKPMKGWLLISEEGLKGKELQKWFDKAVAFAQALVKK